MEKILRFLFIYGSVIWMGVTEHLPVTINRRLIYVAYSAPWYDALDTCHQQYGWNVSLLTDSSVAVKYMVALYQSNDWVSVWDGSGTWIGLFVADLTTPAHQWQSNCDVVNTVEFHNFKSIPTPHVMESDKLCYYGFANNVHYWEFDQCNNSRSAICEEYMGPCTFEVDAVSGACTLGISFSNVITAATQTDCENYCSTLAPIPELGECWAVTFVLTTGDCFPSLSDIPYKFEVTDIYYESVCTQDEIGAGSVVSWKRCFSKPMMYDNVIHGENIVNYDPHDLCAAPTSSTETYTETSSTTTTSAVTTATTPLTTTATTPLTTTATTLLTTTATTPLTTTATTPRTTTATTPPTTTATTPPTTTTTTPPTTTTTTIPQSTTTPPTTTTTTIVQSTTTTPQKTTTTLTTTTTPHATTIPLTTTTTTTPLTTTTTTPPPTTTTLLMTTASPTEATVSSNSTPVPLVNSACACLCVMNYNITLEEKTAQLRKELSLEKRKMSAHTRTLQCAKDDRSSAKQLGVLLGVVVLVSVVLMVSLGDILSLLRSIVVTFRK